VVPEDESVEDVSVDVSSVVDGDDVEDVGDVDVSPVTAGDADPEPPDEGAGAGAGAGTGVD
jgi:hypothetical protein